MFKDTLYTLLIILSAGAVIAGIYKWIAYKNKQLYANKPYWAVSSTTNANGTYNILLYTDSTFFGTVLNENYSGTYRLTNKDLVFFFTDTRVQTSNIYTFETPGCNQCQLIAKGMHYFDNLFFYRKEGVGLH